LTASKTGKRDQPLEARTAEQETVNQLAANPG
jgi:hypothetical protein